MLYSGKKYSNSRVVRKKNFERNKKPYSPCKLNGRSLISEYLIIHWGEVSRNPLDFT